MTRFRRSGRNWEGRRWSVSAPIDSLADALEAAYPTSHPKDGTVASKAHDTNSPNSDHRPKPTSGTGVVRAIDFGEHNEEGFGIMDAIRVSHDPRLKYGIHESQMFSSYASGEVPPFTWRPYGGPNQHLDHGHVSTLTSADGQAGPWDIGTDIGDEMTLKEGNTGNAVRFFQKALNNWRGTDPKLTVSGNFDPIMTTAVKKYQQAANVDATGEIDWLTGILLAEYNPDKVAPPAPVPEIELEVTKVSVVKGVKIK